MTSGERELPNALIARVRRLRQDADHMSDTSERIARERLKDAIERVLDAMAASRESFMAASRESWAVAKPRAVEQLLALLDSPRVIGQTPQGQTVVEHDGVTEWSDCCRCGARLDPREAPEEWEGECYRCGAPASEVGLVQGGEPRTTPAPETECERRGFHAWTWTLDHGFQQHCDDCGKTRTVAWTEQNGEPTK